MRRNQPRFLFISIREYVTWKKSSLISQRVLIGGRFLCPKRSVMWQYLSWDCFLMSCHSSSARGPRGDDGSGLVTTYIWLVTQADGIGGRHHYTLMIHGECSHNIRAMYGTPGKYVIVCYDGDRLSFCSKMRRKQTKLAWTKWRTFCRYFKKYAIKSICLHLQWR